MFSDRVTELLDALQASNQEVSRCADCTPSNISRLKSGARKPDPLSPTIDKLINGVIHYATLHDKMEVIKDLIDEGENESEILESRIRKWLYQDEPIADGISLEHIKDTPNSNFGKKFTDAVTLSEMTNSQISHLLNVDPSLISRFQTGSRTPKSNPEMYDRLCQILFNQIVSINKQDELLELIQLDIPNDAREHAEYSDEMLYQHFHAWLYDFKSEDYMAIHHLLSTIETFHLPPVSEIPEPPEDLINNALSDTSDIYHGVKGLQTAVIRFLASAIKNDAKELLLYSDQDMEWLVKDNEFNQIWAALMAACVSKGIKIKIVHNIERSIREMTAAIVTWFPLYLSGSIEPYYCKRKNGDRFTHTFFICPEVGSIISCFTRGTEENGIYQYFTDNEKINYFIDNYNALLSNCESLASVSNGEPVTLEAADESMNSSILDLQNIRIEVTLNYVNVIKEDNPGITFTFYHPLMCEAFNSYIHSIHPED